MGNLLSVSVSADKTVNCVSDQLCGDGNYVFQLGENLDKLATAVQHLKDRRGDLLLKLKNEEDKGLVRLPSVDGWLRRVSEMEEDVKELLEAKNVEIQRLCLYGCCSENYQASYKYGKDVSKKKGRVEVLLGQCPSGPLASEAKPIQMLDEAWNFLMENGVGILGLYGVGGVGKSRILKQIHNKFRAMQNEFDIVILVVVPRNLEVKMIQEEIGKKLKFSELDWKQKDQEGKAAEIFMSLRKQKFVLLLDNIRKREVKLTDIGIPSPSKENGCKIVFTTHDREVCASIGSHTDMRIDGLSEADAMSLFRKKVREEVFDIHEEIPELAETAVKKCCGSPLAVSIIGEAMASKRTHQEWDEAITVLDKPIDRFPGTEDVILPILKFSYDNLRGEEVKLCFRYFALFPEGYRIRKDELVDYWVGEGIIDGSNDRDITEKQGYDIISALVDACLLTEDNDHIKMHDVVRDMAIWVVQHEEKSVVQPGLQLSKIPEVENWEAVSKMSLMNNRIENISGSPSCPKLRTLFLRQNKLASIPGEFFGRVPNLGVLDLSLNSNLTELAEEISQLTYLKYLNLSDTGIKQLPASIEELRELLYLNLERTRKLGYIVGISGLSNLEVLRLCDSSVPFDLNLLKELQALEHLKLLTLTLKDASVLEQFLGTEKLARCTRHLVIQHVTSSPDGISFPMTLGSLHRIEILDSDISEIKSDKGGGGSEMNALQCNQTKPSSPCFRNLCHVSISKCRNLRHLTWLLFAPELAYLTVEKSSEMEEIISKDRAVCLTNEQPSLKPFPKLKTLDLRRLRQLRSIWQRPLSFSSLRKITIRCCPELRKLPLDSKITKGRNIVIDGEEEWIKELEWKDESTKERFCPC